MPKLIIWIEEEDQLPSITEFSAGTEIIEYADNLRADSPAGPGGLWVASALTAASRAIPRKKKSKVPRVDYSDSAMPLIKSLFWAVSKRRPWLRQIFGVDPKGGLLDAKKRNLRPLVHLVAELDVSFKWTPSGKDCERSELIKLASFWTTLPKRLSKALSASIDVDGHSRYTIDQFSNGGQVSKGDRISICVKSTYPTHLCVFWIDSESHLFSLFPRPDLADVHISKKADEQSAFTLQIGDLTDLDIDTAPGVETCMVLSKPSGFKDADVSELRERIMKHLRLAPAPRPPNAPKFLWRRLPSGSAVAENRPEFGLGAPPPLDRWNAPLIESLAGLAEHIHLAHIPNSAPT